MAEECGYRQKSVVIWWKSAVIDRRETETSAEISILVKIQQVVQQIQSIVLGGSIGVPGGIFWRQILQPSLAIF
jgi:hypothetical protein